MPLANGVEVSGAADGSCGGAWNASARGRYPNSQKCVSTSPHDAARVAAGEAPSDEGDADDCAGDVCAGDDSGMHGRPGDAMGMAGDAFSGPAGEAATGAPGDAPASIAGEWANGMLGAAGDASADSDSPAIHAPSTDTPSSESNPGNMSTGP